MPSTMINLLSLRCFLWKHLLRCNDGAFKTGWFEVDGNRYYGSDYSDDDTPKGNLYTGVINSQLFSPDGKLLTNGLYPEFKRTGENSYELEGVYVTDADGNIKEGPYQYDGKILGSKYITSANHNGQLLTNGIFLMDTSTILTQHLWPSQAPNGQKVTTNVAIATTNKALTYHGVIFNFDARVLMRQKKKLSTLTNCRRIVTAQVISMKMVKKSLAWRPLMASLTISTKMAVKPKAQRSQSMVRLTNWPIDWYHDTQRLFKIIQLRRFSTFSILPNTLLWQWRSCSDRLANHQRQGLLLPR